MCNNRNHLLVITTNDAYTTPQISTFPLLYSPALSPEYQDRWMYSDAVSQRKTLIWAPGWLSLLGTCLQLRSWSWGPGIEPGLFGLPA